MSYLVYLTLIPPLLLGILLVAWLTLPSRKGNVLLLVSLGVPVGFGVVSLIHFIWSLIFHPANPGFFLVEFLLIALLIYLNWKHRKFLDSILPDINRVSKLEWILGGLFVLVAIIGLIIFINFTTANPHGRYDAWAIWNVRARMLTRAGIYWKTVFVPQVFHADYPLLLPFSIAHSWLMAGTESVRIPQAIAGLFTFSTAGILAGGLREFQKKENAWVAGMVLLCLPWFIYNGSRQFADIPQSACILASLVSLSLFFQNEGNSNRWLILSGLLAGISAWVKNEGQLFLLVYFAILGVAAFSIFRKKRGRTFFTHLMIGLLLPLVVLGIFKTTLAPANDVINSETMNQSLSMLFSMDRYREILSKYHLFHRTFGGLSFPFPIFFIISIFLMKPRISAENKVAFFFTVTVLVLQWIGYFVIYVITPHNLANHINTSYERLLLHLYPSILMAAFLLTTPLSDFLKTSEIGQDTPAV